MRSRARGSAPIAALVVALAGCSSIAPLGGVATARPAPFAECDTNDLAFFGEKVTLAGIGIEPSTVGAEANRVATVWVTAGPVAVPGAIPPGAAAPEPQRWVCAEFDDGSAMAMTIDDSWEPPIPVATVDRSGSPAPVGTIAVALAAAAVVVVSYLAFRRGDG